MSDTGRVDLLQRVFSEYPRVIKDPVPFKVLLLVVRHVDNPKSISSCLGVKPPSVMYQLGHLKQIGLVKLGEKEGKIQHYDIDWEGVMTAFLSTVQVSDPQQAIATPLFREMIQEAFESAAKFAIGSDPEPGELCRRLVESHMSLGDFFQEFKTALIKSFPELSKIELGDAREPLAGLLEECYRKYIRFYGTRGDIFWRVAFERVRVVKPKFSALL